ncbi:type II secretion system protein GspM [Methylophilus luteus]|uniref:Type II secretion system protein GspM n=1 Tax=Methylophilus luteus TaxID=640108 RepID=A0ABW3F535_9PROT
MRFEQLHTLNSKWLALSKRERWMIFGAGLFAVIGLLDTFLLEPQRAQVNSTQEEIIKIQNDTAALTEQMNTIATQAAPQPASNAFQHDIDEVNAKIASQSSDLVRISSYMVPPQEMVLLLKKLLQQHTDVQVLEMQSLPVTDFIEKQRKLIQEQTAPASGTPVAGSEDIWLNVPHVYQHAVKVRLKGKYFALMDYAQSLKAISQRVAWETAELKSDYPENELTIQVYTLSGENAWLGI